MALFESYERREKQVLAALNKYGINTIEEAAEVTKTAGLDVYKMVEGIQPICLLSQSKKAAEKLLTLLLQSAKVFSLSVFLVLLLTSVK